MARRVIDTNRLIQIYRLAKVKTEDEAREAASARLRANPDDGVLTPIRIEMLVGTRDKAETRRTEVFLAQFVVFDNGRILPQDWEEAERLAKWVPAGGRARDAVDCLILAICTRLKLDIDTEDTGFPRRRQPL